MYEIDGRLIVRTSDDAGLGIEREEYVALDGFPDVDLTVLGQMVIEALSATRRIPMPTAWPTQHEYAQPLLDAAPKSYRSYRAWQRAARYVSVHRDRHGVELSRWHPDLGRGAWLPAGSVHEGITRGWPQELTLLPTASAQQLGTAILELLAQPSLRDSY